MRTFSLLKTLGLATACLLTMQTAKAQGYFSGASMVGNQDGRFYIQGSKAGVAGPYLQFNPNNDNNNYPTQQGTISYIAGYSASNTNISHNFVVRQYDTNANLGYPSYMRMLQSGQVQIGKLTPQTQTDYALAVDGKVVTKSLYVMAPANWADFVFAPTYQPMSLPMLEAFLQRNKHLPAMPSASEVEANGYSVSEMDAKLLQSVEELTLHVIALSKELEQLKAEKVVATSTK